MKDQLPDLDYKELAKFVICQAIEDVTTWNSKGRGNGAQTWEEAKEAGFFLTSPEGEWKNSRDVWCGLAEIDPDELRIRIMKALSTGKVWRRSDFTETSTLESGD